jgi:hypothetical protein
MRYFAPSQDGSARDTMRAARTGHASPSGGRWSPRAAAAGIAAASLIAWGLLFALIREVLTALG